MKIFGFVLVLMGGLGAVVVPWNGKKEFERDSLHGVWVAQSCERNGKPAPDILGRIFEFRDRTFSIKSKDGEVLYHGTYHGNERANPATIDFVHQDDWLLGTTWKGIFKRDGDTLKICDNAPFPTGERPTDFTTRAESNRVSATMQRCGSD